MRSVRLSQRMSGRAMAADQRFHLLGVVPPWSSTAPPPNCYDYIYPSLSRLDLIGFRVEQPKTALVVSSYLNSPEICPLHKYFGFKWCSAKRVIRSFQIIPAFPTSDTGTQPKSYLRQVANQIRQITSD